jgi:hypothetical protein
MTATEMLVRLRTLFDERLSQFWDDELDCYPALTDGQNEYISLTLAQYKAKLSINSLEPLPETLRVLYVKKDASITTTSITLPTDFLYDISLSLGSPYLRPLLKRELSRAYPFEKANSLLGATGYYYSIINDKINLEIPTPTNPSGVSYGLEYLKVPAKIDSNTNPIAPSFAHQTIVIFAFAQLLKKAGRTDEAQNQYKEFLSLYKYL